LYGSLVCYRVSRVDDKVRVKSVGRLLGEAIKRIHHGDSISSLFV